MGCKRERWGHFWGRRFTLSVCRGGRPALILFFFLLLPAGMALFPVFSVAPASQTAVALERAVAPGGEALPVLTVFTGQSRLLNVTGLRRTAVADPQVAEVVVIADNQLLLNGRRAGRTTLHLWDSSGLHSYLLQVEDDTQTLAAQAAQAIGRPEITVEGIPGALALRGEVESAAAAAELVKTAQLFYPRVVNALKIKEEAPRENVAREPAPQEPAVDLAGLEAALANPAVRARRVGEVVLLEGEVATAAEKERAERLAALFAPRVESFLTLAAPAQVLLSVQAVELSRQGAEKLGLTWYGANASGSRDAGSNTLVQQAPYAPWGPFVQLTGLMAELQALVDKGEAKILAQPSLLVKSGEKASFLAGGEIPVGVPEENKITIYWKEYGIKLEMEPTVQEEDWLAIDLQPEVSTLDWENAVHINGAELPGLRTRRTQTRVRVRDGATLAISGLLYQEEAKSVLKLPLLGDLPLVGALFRSTRFQQRQTDLVFLITPRIIRDSEVPAAKDFLTPKPGVAIGGEGEEKVPALEPPEKETRKLETSGTGGTDGR